MAAVLDDYMDSPMDNDNDTDDVFPCKGCGEVRTCHCIRALPSIPLTGAALPLL
jgi:hypothetical protein